MAESTGITKPNLKLPPKALPIYKNDSQTRILKSLSAPAESGLEDDLLEGYKPRNPEEYPIDTLKYLTQRKLLEETGNPKINYRFDTSHINRSNYVPENKLIDLTFAK